MKEALHKHCLMLHPKKFYMDSLASTLWGNVLSALDGSVILKFET